MTRRVNENTDQKISRPSSAVRDEDADAASNSNSHTTDGDSALVSGLERLAFRLHDLATRLLTYLR